MDFHSQYESCMPALPVRVDAPLVILNILIVWWVYLVIIKSKTTIHVFIRILSPGVFLLTPVGI